LTNALLEIKGLRTNFITDHGEIPAVDGLDICIEQREVLGIVVESGCGKSVMSQSIMGLIPQPPGKIVKGEIAFKGEDLSHASEKRMRKIRGNEIALIFQEPMTSLNLLYTIGDQIGEVVKLHRSVKSQCARNTWNCHSHSGSGRVRIFGDGCCAPRA